MIARAIVVFGLLLVSAEAEARRDGNLASDGERTTAQFQPAQFQPAQSQPTPPLGRFHARDRQPNNLEERLRSTQGKGPVDVISISFTAVLALFFVVALLRRRKKSRLDAYEPSVDLPSARVLSDDRSSSDRIKGRADKSGD